MSVEFVLDLPTLTWDDPDPSWRDDAACLDHPGDTDAFFHGRLAEIMRQEYCASCPVTEQCWNYAIQNGIMNGSWGNRTEKELIAAVRLNRRG